MNILFALSECRPFVASGGLADVGGSLPQAIASKGEKVSVVMPLYGSIKRAYGEKLTKICNAVVALDWRRQKCALFTMKNNDVDYYFIEEDGYYDRDNLYGYNDDIERFAFFCKATCDFLPRFGQIDLIHCNDWQTALISAYVKQAEIKVKTVFTIHNIEYQGKFNIDHLQDLTGLPKGFFSCCFEWNGWGNLLKGAIVLTDLLTTVSPNYAKEIMNAEFASGLNDIIYANRSKLVGVLNGIDTNYYNSETDPDIAANFGVKSLSGKKKCKEQLQLKLGLPVSDSPLIGVVSRFARHKGLDLVRNASIAILEEGAQMAILGTGDKDYEEFFTWLSKVNNNASTTLAFDNKLAKQIYAGCDFFLMPSLSEPCGLAQMIATRYGTLPIVRGVGGLFNSIYDSHNGFVFFNYDSQALVDAVNRALKLYGNKKQLRQMRLNALKSDFSWDISSKKYIELYKTLLTD